MSFSSEDIANLSPEQKRTLLVKLLQEQARGSKPVGSESGALGKDLNQLAASVTELNARAILDPAIRADGATIHSADSPSRILFTGATGFLGAFLLDELLRQTRADIYCLVRCSDAAEGRRRIERNLTTYVSGAGSEGYSSSRIIPVRGEMSEPFLGLSERQFGELGQMIDAIYHCGAWVNWIYPYERLAPTNVGGTAEILRLACLDAAKPVHYVSTISVFPLFNDSEAAVIYEQDSLDHGGDLYGGYMQTKWVAEKLVTVAQTRGLPVAVYRPGLITGHSQTGAWNTDDVTSRIVKSFIELGAAPDLDGATDMTPVDYVSRAIVHVSKMPSSLGRVFHLVNPAPVHARDLVDWIRCFGYPVESVSYEEWRERLVDRAKLSQDEAAHSLAPLFSISLSDESPVTASGYESTSDGLGIIFISQYARLAMRFDCQQAVEELAGTSIACPRVDREIFETYLSYFVGSGFLDAPS